MAMRLLSSTIIGAGNFLRPRARSNISPQPSNNSSQTPPPGRDGRMLDSDTDVFDSIVKYAKIHNGEINRWGIMGRSDTQSCKEGCRVMPDSCCDVRTEVAYPQFGQSAITEETFTIIQDFPDFVQPVFKRVCVSTTCNLLVGNCTQKYVPHAVFSAPSGKFGNLFGQDYLLVESGCECIPVYNSNAQSTNRPSISSKNATGFDVSAVNDNRNIIN